MGGMQRVSMQLIKALNERTDVVVVEKTLHAPWKRIGWYTTGFLMKLALSLPSMIRKSKADVVLFSSMVTATMALVNRKRVPIPMVTINHGQDVTLPVKAYQRLVPHIFEA
ncbi:hypothetical protein RZS08_35245, partial [Arthrospira platensis SPKY1]|nr:hypothetical protein [Arthrospira platensis SPKY1]